MSKREFQHELDDELLSAYLDDELSAEERATVEARLANDPDVQQLLHQLRAVSQTVQMLPLEGVGRDLSADILRRVETKKRGDNGTKSGDTTGIGDVTPRLPIFGSRRSWIWATLAVAAGLMIMVLERGEEKRNALPPVAQNGQQRRERMLEEQKLASPPVANAPAPAAASDASSVAQMDSASPQNSAAGSPLVSATKPQAGVDRLMARDRAAGSPSGAVGGGGQGAETQLAAGTPSDEERRHDAPLSVGGASRLPASATFSAKSPLAENKTSETAGARGEAPAASGKIAAAPSASPGISGERDRESDVVGPVLVVHVVAKPAAFRGGSFEKMLKDNRIAVERQEQPDSTVASDADKDSVGKLLDANGKTPQDRDVDMVLVEAPKDVVASCLASLQGDESNYVSVEVDSRAVSELGTKADLAKSLGEDLRKFNRGVVAQKQESLGRDRFYADGAAARSFDEKDKSRSKAAAAGEPSAPAEKEAVHQPLAEMETRGRAMRLMASDDRKAAANEAKLRNGDTGGFAGGESSTLRRVTMGRRSSGGGKEDDVQVLFVVREETSPAVASPAKKAAE